MRKILTSVLSVAGLLAVVLALASGPATAQKEADPANVDTVIVYTNDEDSSETPGAAVDMSVAGTYSVSWDTLGDCDPGPGTSGASGSLVLTVAATDVLVAAEVDPDPDDTDPAKQAVASREGTEARAVIRTNTDCNYSWEIGLIEAAQGALCIRIADDETSWWAKTRTRNPRVGCRRCSRRRRSGHLRDLRAVGPSVCEGSVRSDRAGSGSGSSRRRRQEHGVLGDRHAEGRPQQQGRRHVPLSDRDGGPRRPGKP